MFDPFHPLLDANHWLGKLEKRSFDFVARALRDVWTCLAVPRFDGRSRKERGVRLKQYGADLTLEDLSDGYQSVLGLTCDIIACLARVCNRARSMPAKPSSSSMNSARTCIRAGACASSTACARHSNACSSSAARTIRSACADWRMARPWCCGVRARRVFSRARSAARQGAARRSVAHIRILRSRLDARSGHRAEVPRVVPAARPA